MGSNFKDKTQEHAIYSDCYKTDIIRLSRSPYYGWNIFFSHRSFVTILLSPGGTVLKQLKIMKSVRKILPVPVTILFM